MITTRYSVDRETWNSWQALVVRARSLSPTLPSLPKAFTLNRWAISALDSLFTAVNAQDGKAPAKLFDNRNWYLGRDRVNTFVQLEARITALGY
jgi:hypothetical protein